MLEKIVVHNRLKTAYSPPLTTEPYILCIEDARPFVGLVRDALQASGYKVVSAADSQQGLALMRTQKPNVLLLDLTIRDSPSWPVYQELKDDQTLADIPVVDVSARSAEVGRARVDDFPPVCDYTPQPTDIERLTDSIKVLAQK